MPTTIRFPLVVLIALLTLASLARAESPDFITLVGHVDKFEKDTLTVTVGDKTKKDKSAKTVELSVTGTSKFHQLVPQVRAGKTVITQRSAETTDLAPGQSIAIIYTVADKDNVLLTAVIKTADKAAEKETK
jgi:predicted SnoaL-like aldol condensation-catalyzing enzyme